MTMNTSAVNATAADSILQVQNLKKYFPIKVGVFRSVAGHVKAVDGVSFSIKRGRTMGLVGESGCGKSTLARVLLRLLESSGGAVSYDGKNVLTANKTELRKLRTRMQIIFQDPFSSLNPRLSVNDIVGEAMLQHKIVANRAEMTRRVTEIIDKCGLSAEHAQRYPHQFSGGQRQRICIARALAVNPDFIVCDEAVSALDVSIQSQIINLLKDRQDEGNLTYLFISHDLSVVKFISDDVCVMYLGQIVESGTKEQIFNSPLHPYTEALLSAAPTFDPSSRRGRKRIILAGDIPSPANPPPGCRFHTRCPYAKEICKESEPDILEIESGHNVMCHKVQGKL